MRIGKEKREFLIPLTSEELVYRASQAAELSEVAAKLKDDAAKLSADATRKDKEAKRMLAVYRAGEEGREVECEQHFSDVLQEVRVIRIDTGETVDRRKPTFEDWRLIENMRQQPIPFPAVVSTSRRRRGSSAADTGEPEKVADAAGAAADR